MLSPPRASPRHGSGAVGRSGLSVQPIGEVLLYVGHGERDDSGVAGAGIGLAVTAVPSLQYLSNTILDSANRNQLIGLAVVDEDRHIALAEGRRVLGEERGKRFDCQGRP